MSITLFDLITLSDFEVPEMKKLPENFKIDSLKGDYLKTLEAQECIEPNEVELPIIKDSQVYGRITCDNWDKFEKITVIIGGTIYYDLKVNDIPALQDYYQLPANVLPLDLFEKGCPVNRFAYKTIIFHGGCTEIKPRVQVDIHTCAHPELFINSNSIYHIYAQFPCDIICGVTSSYHSLKQFVLVTDAFEKPRELELVKKSAHYNLYKFIKKPSATTLDYLNNFTIIFPNYIKNADGCMCYRYVL